MKNSTVRYGLAGVEVIHKRRINKEMGCQAAPFTPIEPKRHFSRLSNPPSGPSGPPAPDNRSPAPSANGNRANQIGASQGTNDGRNKRVSPRKQGLSFYDLLILATAPRLARPSWPKFDKSGGGQ